METLLFTCVVLAVYGLVAAYGFRDVFIAHRTRGDAEEPILAAWHFLVAMLSFVTAGAMILAGMLVAFGGSGTRVGWWQSPDHAGSVMLDVLVGAVSVTIGFALVRITKTWLAPNIGKPRSNGPRYPFGGAHHVR